MWVEQLVAGVQEVWSASALITAVLGGLALGFIVAAARRRRQPEGRWADLVLGLGTVYVAVFWSGQIMDAVLIGDAAWGRTVARALLNELFIVAAAAASYLAWWHDHRAYLRQHRPTTRS